MRILANCIRQNIHVWGDECRETLVTEPIVLLHGDMDTGGTWDLVAPQLGRRAIAPDLRGFGKTDRVQPGGYYHFPDYVADLAQLVDALGIDTFHLVGHSMGGTIATLFTGARPARVRSLVVIEGIGPPNDSPEIAPAQMARWLKDLEAKSVTTPATSMDVMIQRLHANHPSIPLSVIATRAAHLVEPANGGLCWAVDPRHLATSPTPFFASVFRAFAARATCPVLFVSGGGSKAPDEAERLSAFARLSRVEIAGAGHMVHWTKPNELARAICDFTARSA